MSHEKTWQFDMNRAYTPTGANATAVAADLNKYVLWYYKAFLTGQIGGAASGLWTVAGSSDAVSAGMDGVDRWTNAYTNGKITNATAGTPHSWIVLQSPVLGGKTYYLLLDYASGSNYATIIGLSTTAPTGGTISIAPTMQVLASNLNFGLSAAWGTIRMHGSLATDGTFFVLASRDYTSQFFSGLIGSLLANTKALDQYPLFVSLIGDTAPLPAGYGNNDITASANAVMRSCDGTGSPAHGIITPVYSSPNPNTPVSPDIFDGTYWDWPVWVGSATPGYRTIRGRIPDLLFHGGIAPATGCVDNTGAPTFMSVGRWWFPTNVAPLL